MQQLLKLIETSKERGILHATNLTREYVQVLILKAIYQSSFGRALSFMGGTCLRLCYGLKRFSEDLDFSKDASDPSYTFGALNSVIERRLLEIGLPIEVTAKDGKTVDRSFVKLALDPFGLSIRKGQKLHIKVEIDNRPPPVKSKQRERFYLGKYNELFPLIKHAEDVLFAGKMLALLYRPRILGRDCYDLIWYLNRKTPCDFSFLNAGIEAAGGRIPKIKDKKELFRIVRSRLKGISGAMVLADIEPFLEDPSEAEWVRDFPDVLAQVTSNP